MTDEIYIPDALVHPKPWFPTKPNEERAKEILNFISRTSNPHLWPGQTYDKPKADSPIEYVAEFWLNSSKPLAPCPCCRPHHGKYRHGMIAYFPEEQIIRILGHNCFGSINSDKHNEALKRYRDEIRITQDRTYLLNNLGLVPDLLKIVGDAIPVGYAVDTLRNEAVKVFKEVLKTDLYSHIRSGSLLITTVRKQYSNLLGQEGRERDVQMTESYGRIAGQDMLKASYPRLGKRLEQAQQALQQIDLGPVFKDTLSSMSDAERAQAARLLGKSLTSIQDSFKRIDDLRQFTSPVTIATLNGWAKHPDAPLRMHVNYDGPSLQVGIQEFEVRRIVVPPAYQKTLKSLPSIAMKIKATG